MTLKRPIDIKVNSKNSLNKNNFIILSRLSLTGYITKAKRKNDQDIKSAIDINI
jgi:hypothetical protein